MRDVVKRTGQAFEVVGGSLRNPQATAAGHAIAVLSNEASPEDVDAKIKSLEDVIKSLSVSTAAMP